MAGPANPNLQPTNAPTKQHACCNWWFCSGSRDCNPSSFTRSSNTGASSCFEGFEGSEIIRSEPSNSSARIEKLTHHSKLIFGDRHEHVWRLTRQRGADIKRCTCRTELGFGIKRTANPGRNAKEAVTLFLHPLLSPFSKLDRGPRGRIDRGFATHWRENATQTRVTVDRCSFLSAG